MRIVYLKRRGGVLIRDGERWTVGDGFSFDRLFSCEDPAGMVSEALASGEQETAEVGIENEVLAPPMERQEVWAAGVTYYRSRDARMEESERSGGDVFYDRVYEAARPELFIKGGITRTVGHGEKISIRSDSAWDVPEPELAVAVSSRGEVFGFTVGNDVSSREIEGENLLYLPQAKVWRNSCALGPGLLIADAMGAETPIGLRIERGGDLVFSGETSLAQMKRSIEELVGWLMRDNVFPWGCYLLTGTGVVPDAGFSLASGDVVRIRIEGIGELSNEVE
ncbi:MAG: fumarylacetoacetate hydrolase family protein [Verrucomicrobiota bacterium]